MQRFADLPWTPLYTQRTGWGTLAEDSTTETPSFLAYWSLAATVTFTLAVYAAEGYLDARQKTAYQKTVFPEELETTVSAIDRERTTVTTTPVDANTASSSSSSNEPLLPQLKAKFRNAQAYGLDKINFGRIASTYDVIESVSFLIVGFLPYAWDLSLQWGQQWFGWSSEEQNEINISLLFLAFITVVGTITSLPFELYSTFQIERKHGFNKQTLGLFFSDKIKSLILTFVIGGPFVSLLLYIIKAGGEFFYLYVWAFMFAFSVFMMTIVPVFIMPLFNKYEPLVDGDLKRSIFELAAKLQYPLTKLFVMDGSKRSSHSNAFMFGFGNNKRIVLFDTLMTQVHEDEILAILGHELGHWKLGHTLTSFAITQTYFGAAFYFFSLTYGAQDLYSAFGFDENPSRPVPSIIALLLFFQTLWAPVDKILSFVMTIVSRRNEFAADKFSVDLGMSKKLQSGLCKIHLENLGAMAPDPLYSTYHYSHPPLVERLGAMMAMDQKIK
jgi:STE24 endopeptidase